MPEADATKPNRSRALLLLSLLVALVVIAIIVLRDGGDAGGQLSGEIDYSALPDTPVGRAVADPGRPESERMRDAGRKPHEVLAFYGVEPGMRLLELGAGAGYYTRILSKAVGPEGAIIAQNSERFWPRLEDDLVPLYEELGNVTAHVGDVTQADIAPGSLDGIFVVLIWHHMHGNDEEGFPQSSVDFLAKAREWLKPGGYLAIVEHEAAAGTSRSQAAQWHRTPAPMTIADVTAHGFEFAGASDVLANPDDDLRNYWREALPVRDSSQRYVLKFVKP